MEPVILRCPKCGEKILYKNYFMWMLCSPMHWFGKRYTKCHCCGRWNYMKKEQYNYSKYISIIFEGFMPIQGYLKEIFKEKERKV